MTHAATIHALDRAEPKPKPRRRRRRWLIALGVVLVLLLLVPVGLRLWLYTDSGRGAVARLAEHFVSEGIRGTLSVASVEDVSSAGIVAHGIRFTDQETGHVVLEADEAEVALNWGALLSGHFVSPHARVHGGRVVLETLASGQLLIDRAFRAPNPGPPGQPVGPDIVRFDALVASNVDVVIEIHGAPGMRVVHTNAIVLLHVPDHGAPQLRADRIDATIHLDAPSPIDMSVEDGTLSFDGVARQRATIGLPTTLNGRAIQIDIVVRADAHDDMHVAVHLIPSDVFAAMMTAPLLMQALVAETMTDALDVTVDLR